MSTFLLFIGADSYWARSICQIKHVGKIPVTLTDTERLISAQLFCNVKSLICLFQQHARRVLRIKQTN